MGERRPRLMVLGAGIFQLAGIRRAVDLGCEVITVDYLPDNIGHRVSHRYVNASTTDEEAVLQAAVGLDIDGIVTFSSDVATRTVAAVGSKLGLPTADPTTVEAMSNKGAFRRFQAEQGLPSPRCVTVGRSTDLSALGKSWTEPAIVKPVDSSGSRGVRLVSQAFEWAPAVEDALGYSRTGEACVESLVEGTEVGGDCFFRKGELVSGVATWKHLDGFLVAGHSLPGQVSSADESRVLDAVSDTCKLLGLTDGPVNFDVMVQRDEVVVLEMSPRTGGNGIPELIEYATGFDGYAATINQAMGKPIELARDTDYRGCGSAVFGSPTAGRLTKIVDSDQLLLRDPDIFGFYSRYSRGDFVPAYAHGGDSMGYVLFSSSTPGHYRRKVSALPGMLDIEVEASP